MKCRWLLLVFTCSFSNGAFAQNDTATTLQEVVIRAFEQNRQLKEVSGAINYIGANQLERFSNTSILPALNATPGVRMEERSPGSYRLNIRGSTLRSSFGVRNVKVYWNGIPFTDPGGNTYLNQLGYFNVRSIEVIKGPAGSLYGAGTGGAMLINSQPDEQPAGASVNYMYGSYNLNSLNAQVRLGEAGHRHVIGYTHQTSDGYRQHTRMRRDIATWETQIKSSDKQQLQASVLYGDLFYETPGGLNATEYKANPRAARPNADVVKAAIYQKTFLAGLTHRYRFNERFENTTVVYGAFTQIKNPTYLNYERRTEPHLGGRTVFTGQHQLNEVQIQWLAGAELQVGFFNTKVFQNNQGNPDTLQTDDDIYNRIGFVFVQTDIRFPGDWTVSAGASLNQSAIRITRLSVPLFTPVKRTYNNELAPRLAVSKKIIPNLLLYGSVAKGYSPPATQEVLPSTSVISTGLNAEQGVNYEAGIKSSWLQQRLYVEVNAFHFRLQNAIVLRRNDVNADYYVNAGSTKQQGIESQAAYQLLPHSGRFITNARVWASHTWNHFRYRSFVKDTVSYAGNQLPSVAPQLVAAGVDLATRLGLYTHITWFYSDAVPLNDANSVSASSYHVAGARVGWRVNKKWTLDVFGGVDNLFDTKYSLGNDINSTVGRYYNAAAGRNYYVGITLQSPFK
jgi:Outer membrane receptor proteins, mostly Fe transport